MTDDTRPEPPPARTEMQQLRDSVSDLQTIVNRVREAVGTDEPAPVRESYRVRVLETRVSDAEYERDRARERAEAASRVGTQYVTRAERADATIERVRALAAQWAHTGQAPNACIDMDDAAEAIRAALGKEPGPAATKATEPAPAAREVIAAALYEHGNPGLRWADAHEHDRVLFGNDADAVLAVILPGTRAIASLARSADADVQRVIALYEQWVKAGAPPLGTSLARWWDARLIELHEAIRPTDGQTGCRCHNGDELCSGCRRCPDICRGCDGPEYETDGQTKEQ